MDTTALLGELEPLTHAARMARMVVVGRDPAFREVLAELAASPDTYARRIGFAGHVAAGDGAAVAKATKDTSRLIRRLAVRHAARLCSDAELAALLAGEGNVRRVQELVVFARRRGRHGVVDAALAARMAQGDKQALDLLAYASPPVIAAHKTALDERASWVAWARYARWHPEDAARDLAAAMDRAPTTDARLRYRLASVISLIAKLAPDAALPLVQRLLARHEEAWAGAAIQKLARSRPAAIFDLLRARHELGPKVKPPGIFGMVSFDRGAAQLGADRLAYLVEHAFTTLSDGRQARRWYLRLAPAERAAVAGAWLVHGKDARGGFLLRYVAKDAAREAAFERWSIAARDAEGVIPTYVLDSLPRDLRAREGLRHLQKVPALASKPDQRIAYAQLLSFEEARVEIAAQLGHPEGERRALAAYFLLSTLRFDRAAMPAALEWIHARRFEQDPVRGSIFQALVELPVASVKPETLEAVGVIVRDALDAADLSGLTAGRVENLVLRLFRVDAAWAARWVAVVVQTRGTISGYGIGEKLTAAEIAPMVPAITQLVRDWSITERAPALLALGRSFGIRLPLVTPLLDAIEEIARSMPLVGIAYLAFGLLKEHARARYARVVSELCVKDPSVIIVDGVAQFLSTSRQDLLDPFLLAQPMLGRFATGKTDWVILFHVGLARWTRRQQELHAARVMTLAEKDTLDIPTVREITTELVGLAYAPPEPLFGLADDGRAAVRETAVRALPHLDGGQGVALLLTCLGDDRARWAIYALRKALSELPRARVLEILSGAPTTKVTVAKEVLRLLGELGGDEAYAILLKVDRPKMHRDVRIAFLRALWDHLDKEPTWPFFERAVADPDPVLASRVADIPFDRMSPAIEARTIPLFEKLLLRPEPEARLALLHKVAALPLRDPARILFGQCLAHVGVRDPGESAAAFSAVLLRMLPTETEQVVTSVGALLGSQPKNFELLIGSLAGQLTAYAASTTRNVGRGLLAALATEREAVRLYLTLASRLLDEAQLVAAITELATRGLLHADAMQSAEGAIGASVHPELVEAALATSPNDNLRRLALHALRESAAPGKGWTAERLARLQIYRRDASPMVAEAARFTFPPD